MRKNLTLFFLKKLKDYKYFGIIFYINKHQKGLICNAIKCKILRQTDRQTDRQMIEVYSFL